MSKRRSFTFEDAQAAWAEIKGEPDFGKLTFHHVATPQRVAELCAKHGQKLPEILGQWGINIGFARILESRADMLRQHHAEIERAEAGELGLHTTTQRLLHKLLGERGRGVEIEICSQFEQALGITNEPDPRDKIIEAIRECDSDVAAMLEKAGFRISAKLREHLASLDEDASWLTQWAEAMVILKDERPAPAPPDEPAGPCDNPPASGGTSGGDAASSDGKSRAPLPPITSEEQAVFGGILERIRDGECRLTLAFPDVWAVWRCGVTAHREFGIHIGSSLTVNHVLEVLGREAQSDPAAAAQALRSRGIRDERLLTLFGVFCPAFVAFARELDVRLRELYFKSSPAPTWEELQANPSFAKLGLTGPDGLVALVERHGGDVGKAMRNQAFVGSHTIPKVRHFLAAEGAAIVRSAKFRQTPITLHLTEEQATILAANLPAPAQTDPLPGSPPVDAPAPDSVVAAAGSDSVATVIGAPASEPDLIEAEQDEMPASGPILASASQRVAHNPEPGDSPEPTKPAVLLRYPGRVIPGLQRQVVAGRFARAASESLRFDRRTCMEIIENGANDPDPTVRGIRAYLLEVLGAQR